MQLAGLTVTVYSAFKVLLLIPFTQVNLNNPSKTILVQLTRNACAVGVSSRYREFNKVSRAKEFWEHEHWKYMQKL